MSVKCVGGASVSLFLVVISVYVGSRAALSTHVSVKCVGGASVSLFLVVISVYVGSTAALSTRVSQVCGRSFRQFVPCIQLKSTQYVNIIIINKENFLTLWFFQIGIFTKHELCILRVDNIQVRGVCYLAARMCIL